MRVFVTGATGFIGTQVVLQLLAAGHQVLGLARNEKAVAALRSAGAEAHPGDLQDLESLRQGALATDAILHLGFIHDFTHFPEMCEVDRRAIEVMGEALLGTEKPFVVTSGAALFATDKPSTEESRIISAGNPRAATEQAVDALAAQDVRVSVVRLAPSVHGAGDVGGFVPMLIKIAKEKGFSAYSEVGNSWCAVPVLDAAKLYVLAMEKQSAPGTRYQGVAEGKISFQSIAEAIGKGLSLPVKKLSKEEAVIHFGWFSHFATIDAPASSAHTQEVLGWNPTHAGLLEDLAGGVYF
jgi:nucleoside-diphosphate-sugar epimerase